MARHATAKHATTSATCIVGILVRKRRLSCASDPSPVPSTVAKSHAMKKMPAMGRLAGRNTTPAAHIAVGSTTAHASGDHHEGTGSGLGFGSMLGERMAQAFGSALLRKPTTKMIMTTMAMPAGIIQTVCQSVARRRSWLA